ncbi:MAG: hypothetical protein GY940_45035 [bacterium]|nr:hypothetical protein [bacterium]
MKKLLPLIIAIIVFSFPSLGTAEVIERIYAVVNGELITYSELQNAEIQMTRVLSEQYKGDELAKQVEKMKAELLDRLIEQKVILSFALDKNYDVDSDVELIIKNIKEQNNITTDEELEKAIAGQGIDFREWKKQIKETRIQQRFIFQEIGSKINIDNSAIMSYYKANIQEYTQPAKFTLNCIFLNKADYTDIDKLNAKQDAIDLELKQAKFEEVAKKHTQLPDSEILLGTFKKGELDTKIEKAAEKLKTGEFSDWVETDTGYYIVHMAKYVEPQLVEYRKVRTDIENKLRNQQQDLKMTDYVAQLKKESHIKIFKK